MLRYNFGEGDMGGVCMLEGDKLVLPLLLVNCDRRVIFFGIRYCFPDCYFELLALISSGGFTPGAPIHGVLFIG